MGAPVADIVLGTAAYMSPEQAKGQPVDQRSDIWSFGVVLYEMVSGKRLFAGETTTDVLASVLKEEPRWERVPVQVQRLLQRCLEKDPHKRLRHIGDALALVDERSAAPQMRRGWSAWVLAVALLVALGVVTLLYFQRPDPSADLVRFEVEPPDETNLGLYFDLSPDGRRLAFLAAGPDGRSNLWVRELDSVESTMLPGTQGARTVGWSPDSRQISFFAQNRLHKVNAAGDSPPQLVFAGAGNAGSATWNDDDLIPFGGFGTGTIRSVSADGGPLTELTTVDPARRARRCTGDRPSDLRRGGISRTCVSRPTPMRQGIDLGLHRSPTGAAVHGEDCRRLSIKPSQRGKGHDGTGYSLSIFATARSSRGLSTRADSKLTGEPMIIREGVGSFLAPDGFFSMGRPACSWQIARASASSAARHGPDSSGERFGSGRGPGRDPGPGACAGRKPDPQRTSVAAGLSKPRHSGADGLYTRRPDALHVHLDGSAVADLGPPTVPVLIFVSIRDGRQAIRIRRRQAARGTQARCPNRAAARRRRRAGRAMDGSVPYASFRERSLAPPMEPAGEPFALPQTDSAETQARFSPDGKNGSSDVSNESTPPEV